MFLTKEEEMYLDDAIRHLGLDHFNPYYFVSSYDDMYDYFRHFAGDGFEICSGATKAVINIDDFPYVIKIPFFSEREWDYEYEEYRYTSMKVDEAGEIGAYYPLEDRRGKNYCQSEAEMAHLAKLYGVSELFAETEFYCVYNSKRGDKWPIYIQKKVSTSYSNYQLNLSNEESSHRSSMRKKIQDIQDDTAQRMRERTGKWVHKHVFPPTYFMADIILRYGESKLRRMLEFCWLYNINDLHSSNVGYVDGKPVIFDYSGFHNF